MRVAAGLLLALCTFAAQAGGRIVLLLGEDHAGYFSAAAQYYATAEPDAAIVSGVRSLAQAREELIRRADGGPWQRIVLVGHGTEWTGLTVPVFAQGRPASRAALDAAHASGEFPPLPPHVIDAATELVVESCGLGRRPDYLAALAALLAEDPAQRPRLRATSNLVWFGAQDRAERRELPYATRLLRGKADAAAVAQAAAAAGAELAPSLGGAQTSTLALPVHIRVDAVATQLEHYRRIEDYLAQLPSGRSAFGAAGLPVEALLWRRKTTARGLELAGEATLVLVMQRAPDRRGEVPAALDFGGLPAR